MWDAQHQFAVILVDVTASERIVPGKRDERLMVQAR
jgi:hypothetical protein